MKCVATASTTGKRCRRNATVGDRCGQHQLTVAQVAAEGDRRAALEALRQTLATAIDDGPPPYVLPKLTKQLSQVLRELDELGGPEEATVVDDLAARRAERRAASTGS